MLITKLNTSEREDARAQLPEEKKMLITQLDTSARSDARENLSEGDKLLVKHLNTTGRQRARVNLPSVKKTIIKKKDLEAKKKLTEDPYFKKSHAVYNAEFRRQKVQRLNSTIQGRKRIFHDEVKNGPIYCCLSCKRRMYDHSVVCIDSSL